MPQMLHILVLSPRLLRLRPSENIVIHPSVSFIQETIFEHLLFILLLLVMQLFPIFFSTIIIMLLCEHSPWVHVPGFLHGICLWIGLLGCRTCIFFSFTYTVQSGHTNLPVYKSLPASYSFQHLVLSGFLFFIHIMGMKWNHVFLIILLILSEVMHFKVFISYLCFPSELPIYIFNPFFFLFKDQF